MEANESVRREKVKASHTGGYRKKCTPAPVEVSPLPPGLHVSKENSIETPNGVLNPNLCSKDPQPPKVNSFIGSYPPELESFDLTQPEDALRTMLYGNDTWLIPEEPLRPVLEMEPDTHSYPQIEEALKPYLMGIPEDLHPSILNWMEVRNQEQTNDLEPLLAASLRNIHDRGNSRMRQLSPSTLAKFRSLDRFRAGSGGVCRITWGPTVKLDDCVCQTITIGELQFSAVDYGDTISLNELMQQRLPAVDKEERNQCTLLSVASGIVARELKHKTAPASQRVLRTASELRWEEWSIAQLVANSDGNAKSANERNIFSLCHDIVQPNHDRDYRSLALFLGPFIGGNKLTIRVFGVLHTGSG